MDKPRADFYKVTIPKGTHLARFKEKSGFIGTAVGGARNSGTGTAESTSV